jgi:valyl-tRNA synthetase
MPYVTETIWREVAPLLGIDHPTIMTRAFPEASDLNADPEADAAIAWLKGVVVGVRNIRGEANIKPGQSVKLLLQGGNAKDRELADATSALLKRLAKLDDIRWLDDRSEPPASALALVGDLKVMVPLAGLIDIDAERARLNKEIDRLRKDLDRIRGKLANEKFLSNAPRDVVDKETAKAKALEAQLLTLQAQLGSL